MRCLLLLIALALAACSSSSAQPAPPLGDPVLLQLDLASCRPLDRSSYDGDLWLLDDAGLRCSVQIEAGDIITEWAVFGRRDAGDPTARGCLQYLETVLTSEAATHRAIGPCADARSSNADGAWSASFPASSPTRCTPEDPRCPTGQFCLPVPGPVPTEVYLCGWPTSEDAVWSLLVTGSPGDRAGAGIVYVMRP